MNGAQDPTAPKVPGQQWSAESDIVLAVDMREGGTEVIKDTNGRIEEARAAWHSGGKLFVFVKEKPGAVQ
jgi:hypothetical protein